jgi:type III restriction enzyme
MIEKDIEIIKSDFEMVNYWMQQTYLPRKALFKILEGIQKKPLLQIQDVLDECMKIIMEKLTEQKVKHINYEMIDGFTFEVSDIFEMEDIKQEMLRIKRAYKTKEDFKHTIYEFIRVDSDGEYEFARNLDDDKDVLLFTKLKKGGLVIDTPYGGYSPDWAIIHRYHEDTAKLYFIIETKCDKDAINLSEIEKVKINCAKKHFESLGADIIFDWVNGYKRFKEIVGERLVDKR